MEGERFLGAEEELWGQLHTFVQDARSTGATPCDLEDVNAEGVEIERMSAVQTFHTVAMRFGGRTMTAQEREELDSKGEEALGGLIARVLDEPAFDHAIRETFNDVLLTDAGLVDRVSHPGDYLDEEHFPDHMWFAKLDVSERQEPSDGTRLGLVRGPLELIVHVIKNDHPFSEVLTADYVMMNAFAAKSYGVFDAQAFADPHDPDEFHPFTLGDDPLCCGDYPTAGILTNAYYLHRYPSTQTNRNRHRSRMVYQHFLGVDVMGLTPSREDPTKVAEFKNPVLDAPQCSVCHKVIDPMAGLFQKHDHQGRRRPTPDTWYQKDMLPPGFESTSLPADAARSPLQWLASQVVKDPRFVHATAKHAYRLVFSPPAP